MGDHLGDGRRSPDHDRGLRAVTLRLRLVIALLVLVTVGLAVFGFTTYGLYARSQYDRLDDEIRASVPPVTGALFERAGFDRPGPSRPAGEPDPRLLTTYAQLIGADGTVDATLPGSGDDEPDLPDDLTAGSSESGRSPHERLFSTGSVDGSTRWRVLVTSEPDFLDYTVVVAVPMNDVRSSLERLVIIEASAAAVLLALLGAGAWLVLRRGLRPLERMSAAAGTITAGDLAARVEPADGRTEVGQLGLAINTMLDDLEVAFRQREASEARLRQFLADASHELRTPLTSIQGFAELFRLGTQSADSGNGRLDQATMMRRIEDESTRMRHLVDDLLLLARLDETRPASHGPVDLAVLAADACSDAVAADPGRPVTLDAPEPVVVLGDEDHLRQAIGNLVANALRHTPAGTPVEVGAHLADGRAAVTVRDRGAGLDDEALAHAFDRFWRSDSARSGAGAGLGLSIVAGIAAEHGGTASVANAADGGAAFTLDLPIDSSSS
jgi:two-component system OmpR family sensor kinase